MDLLVPIIKLAGGVGLFLFAMYLIEESLKNLSGRRFKLFLQRITKNSIGAVAGGAIVTGVLQSSSMVSLIVLAFVGAGVFTMKNALAIILDRFQNEYGSVGLSRCVCWRINADFVWEAENDKIFVDVFIRIRPVVYWLIVYENSHGGPGANI